MSCIGEFLLSKFGRGEVPQWNKPEFTHHVLVQFLKHGIVFRLLNFLSMFWFETQFKI